MSPHHLVAAIPLALLAACQSIPSPGPKSAEYSEEMQSGDWYLLCDNQKNCAIRGMAEDTENGPYVRAMVMFTRRAGMTEYWSSHIAFLDRDGGHRSIMKDRDTLKLISSSHPHEELPITIERARFSDRPLYRVLAGPILQSKLALYKPELIQSNETRGENVASLPQGNVLKLLLHAEDIQQGTREDYRIDNRFRAFQKDHTQWQKMDNEFPLTAKRLCGPQTPVLGRHWQSADGDKIWLVGCKETMRVYQQISGRKIEQAQLRNREGRAVRVLYHNFFDPHDAVLTASTGKNSNEYCGTRLQWKWKPEKGFTLMGQTYMPICRGIPAMYWPQKWRATDT